MELVLKKVKVDWGQVEQSLSLYINGGFLHGGNVIFPPFIIIIIIITIVIIIIMRLPAGYHQSVHHCTAFSFTQLLLNNRTSSTSTSYSGFSLSLYFIVFVWFGDQTLARSDNDKDNKLILVVVMVIDQELKELSSI